MTETEQKKKRKTRIKIDAEDNNLYTFQDVCEKMFNEDCGLYQNIHDLSHFILSNENMRVMTFYMMSGKKSIIDLVTSKEEYEKLWFRKFNGKLTFTLRN